MDFGFGNNRSFKKSSPWMYNVEVVLIAIVVLSALVLLWQIFGPGSSSPYILVIGGFVFTASLVVLIRLLIDPESVRARQTDSMLKLARQTLAWMSDGLDRRSAQKICELLLPSTAAVAVCITDTEYVLGYAGIDANDPLHQPGAKMMTDDLEDVLVHGKMTVFPSLEDTSLRLSSESMQAAIVAPLYQGRNVVGTITFLYRRSINITATQRSIADGFGQLLSTQMGAIALEEQTKLATSMKLKALQAQINPHFLFNTINTIASLIRTDPNRARQLLREFAAFYRSTLEDSGDLIPLSREIDQVQRYFGFEVARFGEERVCLNVDMEPGMGQMMVPPFLIQPLVENAVHHAMPAEGKLTVTVSAKDLEEEIVLSVTDDGVGMNEETRQNILHPETSTGMGIAVGNVHDRMVGYFGPGTHMDVESELGKGTTIYLHLFKEGLAEYAQE